jgi:mannonate dehydratase
LFYEHRRVAGLDLHEHVRTVNGEPGLTIPGWEPERLQRIGELFEAYRSVSVERLWEHLKYFLDAVVPVAEQHGIRMAIHPDDPPWPIFGLPRIITGRDGLRRLLQLHDSPYNGVTLCSGSLGANPDNDIAAMIREFADRIPFAHIRNVRVFANGNFIETSHRTQDGTVDVAGIVRAFHERGYEGYCRPDHGRHIWGERCRPGYGLYDRALGIMYIWGLWDAYRRGRLRGLLICGQANEPGQCARTSALAEG